MAESTIQKIYDAKISRVNSGTINVVPSPGLSIQYVNAGVEGIPISGTAVTTLVTFCFASYAALQIARVGTSLYWRVYGSSWGAWSRLVNA